MHARTDNISVLVLLIPKPCDLEFCQTSNVIYVKMQGYRSSN